MATMVHVLDEEETFTGVGTARFVQRLGEVNPLVQCITNFVSMDLMANTLLAAGASPAMVRRGEGGPRRLAFAPGCPSRSIHGPPPSSAHPAMNPGALDQ